MDMRYRVITTAGTVLYQTESLKDVQRYAKKEGREAVDVLYRAGIVSEPGGMAEIQHAAANAQYSFWERIVREFPQIKAGDMPTVIQRNFMGMCETYIERWLVENCPITDGKS